MSDTNAAGNTAIESMFKAGAHLGYSRSRRHASVAKHLFGAKNGVDIIDLEETSRMLDAARARLMELGKLGKVVLFVGTKSEIRDFVKEAARSVGMPYVTERWLGGTLTNWPEIRKRTNRLKELTDKFSKGEMDKYTKKEKLLFERELADLEVQYGGIASLESAPAAVLVVDPREEHIAVREAKKMKIETIALMNSDCNKDDITYPVLANDSALESVKYFLGQLSGAYEEGQKART